MITLVFGQPGSGKTYYSVWLVRKKCLEEGDVFYRVKPNVLLLTNIKLNLESSEGYVYIQDWDRWKEYLSVDFWRSNLQYVQGKKIFIVIDEAQVLFSKYKDDQAVMYFFQYHRHLSVEIVLITQSPRSLPKKIYELAEYVVQAVPRVVNPFSWKSFRYRLLHPLDFEVVLRRFHIPFDDAVFYLYSDMVYEPPEGEEKVGNAFVRFYLLVGFFLLLAVFSIFSFFRSLSPSVPLSGSQSVSESQSVQQEPVGYQLTYEDLITEVKEEPQGELQPLQFQPREGFQLREEPSRAHGYYRIVVGEPSYEEVKLVDGDGPKVIILP